MDIRVTSFSNFPALTKTSAKNNYSTSNSKKPHSSDDNKLVVLSKKKTNVLALQKPRFSLKITPSLIQSNETLNKSEGLNKKGVLLYQQIERNKSFTSGSELVNRFHLKA